MVAGSLAQQILSEVGVSIKAYVSSVGSIRLNKCYKNIDLSKIDENIVRCPDSSIAKKMIEVVEKIKKRGRYYWWRNNMCCYRIPVFGWGEPVFEKLHAEIGKAMLSINLFMDLNTVLMGWIFQLLKEVR